MIRKKKRLIKLMLSIDDNYKCMYEGINVNNPSEYTRPWFSWANAVFAGLVLNYCGYSIGTQ